jgi:hypothetical protein
MVKFLAIYTVFLITTPNLQIVSASIMDERILKVWWILRVVKVEQIVLIFTSEAFAPKIADASCNLLV